MLGRGTAGLLMVRDDCDCARGSARLVGIAILVGAKLRSLVDLEGGSL